MLVLCVTHGIWQRFRSEQGCWFFSCQLCSPYLLFLGKVKPWWCFWQKDNEQFACSPCPWAPFSTVPGSRCWWQQGQAAAPRGLSRNTEARAQAALCSRLSLQKGCTETFSSSQKPLRVLAALALPSPDLTRPLCPETGKGGLKHKRENLSLKSYLKKKLTCSVIGNSRSILPWWAQRRCRDVCEIFHLWKKAI